MNIQFYMNGQTGKEMHVKYHVYQQPKSDEYREKLNLIIIPLQIIRWNIVYNCLRH